MRGLLAGIEEDLKTKADNLADKLGVRKYVESVIGDAAPSGVPIAVPAAAPPPSSDIPWIPIGIAAVALYFFMR